MKCGCGGEIDFTTGCCKECKTQNIKMSGNASIRMKERNGDITEIKSSGFEYTSRHKSSDEKGPTINFK